MSRTDAPLPATQLHTIAIEQALWAPTCPLVPLEDDKHAAYDSMFAQYVASPAGQHHRQQVPRFYAGYGCAELNEADLLALGADAHPVDHMSVTHFWFQQIVSVGPGLFTPDTVHRGRLSSMFHDLGENTYPELAALAGIDTPPGDVAFGRKTDMQRLAEARIRRAAYATILPEWPKATIEDVEDIITHRARPHEPGNYDDAHPLAPVDEALELAHVMGSLGIARQAALRLTQEHALGEPLNAALCELVHNVYDNAQRTFKRYAPIFRFAGGVAAQYTWVPEMLRSVREPHFIAA